MTTSKAGTIPYMAPEIINGDEYNKECDVWSLGIILYQLMTFRLPFDGDNMRQLSRLIRRNKYESV